MSVGERRAMITLVAVVLLGPASCYRSPAPRGWLPDPDGASRDAYGSWIRVEDRSADPGLVVQGELIAVDRDTIHVLGFTPRLVSLPRSSVCCVTLTAFHMNYGPLAAWGGAGTLSTVSHGFGLILTAPLWAIISTAAAASASYAPRVQSTDPEVLRRFARFPQGIPPTLDRPALRPKPWPTATPSPRRGR